MNNPEQMLKQRTLIMGTFFHAETSAGMPVNKMPPASATSPSPMQACVQTVLRFPISVPEQSQVSGVLPVHLHFPCV